jgi:hypothetical protein
MRTIRVSKVPSSCQRKVLATRVASKGKEVEILYSGYTTSGSLCVFSDSSTRCVECVHRGVRYDGNFSAHDFNRLSAEQRKLEAVRDAILERVPQETERIAQETREALHYIDKETQEALSLSRRIKALKRAKGKMIKREA